ncbi:MAG: NUDIX domain-containing protein [Patescibacteria group bacterium]
MKEEKSFGLIPIFKKDNETLFFIIQHNAGHWGFPKGHKEFGESDIESAKREFKEESGIEDFEIIDEDIYFEERYIIKRGYEDMEKIVKYYIGVVKNQDVHIQKREVMDYKWLNFDDANNILTFKEGKELLRRVLDRCQLF